MVRTLAITAVAMMPMAAAYNGRLHGSKTMSVIGTVGKWSYKPLQASSLAAPTLLGIPGPAQQAPFVACVLPPISPRL